MTALNNTVINFGVSKAGRSSYNSGCRSFERFQSVRGRSASAPSEADLAMWVNFEGQFISVKAIKVYLYGIRRSEILQGRKDPLKGAIILKATLDALKKKYPRVKVEKFALTLDVWADIKKFFDFSTHDGRMLWACGTCGIYCLWRACEFLAQNGKSRLLGKHYTVGRKSSSFRMDASKTDVWRASFSSEIFPNGTATCPIAACMDAFRGRRVEDNDPLFTWSDGRAIDRKTALSCISGFLVRAGYPKDGKVLGAVSFRRGGATSLSRVGRPDREIQAMGRWKSWCYALYTENSITDREEAAAAMSKLSLAS